MLSFYNINICTVVLFDYPTQIEVSGFLSSILFGIIIDRTRSRGGSCFTDLQAAVKRSSWRGRAWRGLSADLGARDCERDVGRIGTEGKEGKCGDIIGTSPGFIDPKSQ